MRINFSNPSNYSLRAKVFIRDRFTCNMCGWRPENPPKKYTGGYKVCGDGDNWLEVDHMIPVSKGGSNNIRNLQTLCAHCNRRKDNKLMLDDDHYLMKLIKGGK